MTLQYGFAAQDIIEEGRLNKNDIDELKTWLEIQNVPALTDEQVVLFLLSCNNNQEETRNTIKSFFSVRNKAPEFFTNRHLERKELQHQLNILEFCVMPERTDNGCAIIFHRLYDSLYSNYNMEPAMKLLFMTLDAAIYDHPPTGLVILFDMKGVGLMHLTRARIGLVRTFFQYLQECLPVQLKEIHVLNVVYFFDKIMSIIKPFIRKELLSLLHLHSTSVNMEDFYKNCIPKKCLPVEFGGDLPSVRDLHRDNIRKLAELKFHFDAEERQRTECN